MWLKKVSGLQKQLKSTSLSVIHVRKRFAAVVLSSRELWRWRTAESLCLSNRHAINPPLSNQKLSILTSARSSASATFYSSFSYSFNLKQVFNIKKDTKRVEKIPSAYNKMTGSGVIKSENDPREYR